MFSDNSYLYLLFGIFICFILILGNIAISLKMYFLEFLRNITTILLLKTYYFVGALYFFKIRVVHKTVLSTIKSLILQLHLKIPNQLICTDRKQITSAWHL